MLLNTQSKKNVTSPSLQKLKQLTEDLIGFPELEYINSRRKHSYRIDEGTCYAWNLKNIPGKISCADWFNSADTSFPTHIHADVAEWIIVYEGSMLLTLQDSHPIELTAGRFKYIPADVPHSAYFPIDTRYIGITIPDSPDWPT